MPIYEYYCSNCGQSFEKMTSFSQAGEKPACPDCGSSETNRKISLVSTGKVSAGNYSSGSCGSSRSGGFT